MMYAADPFPKPTPDWGKAKPLSNSLLSVSDLMLAFGLSIAVIWILVSIIMMIVSSNKPARYSAARNSLFSSLILFAVLVGFAGWLGFFADLSKAFAP